MPGGFSDSVAAQYFIAGVRLKKAGVQPEEGWRVFGYFLHEQKVPRGAGVEPPPTSTEAGKAPGSHFSSTTMTYTVPEISKPNLAFSW